MIHEEGELAARHVLYDAPGGILQFTTVSPDGGTIASVGRLDGRMGLLLCGALPAEGSDGGCRIALLARGAVLQPRYADDGQILFSSNADGIFNLYAFAPATGAVRRLTRTIGGLFHPTPAGDGLYALAYFSGGFDVVHFRPGDLLSEPVDYFGIPSDRPSGAGAPGSPRPLEESPQGPEAPAPPETSPALRPGWTLGDYESFFALRPFLTGLVNPGLYPGPGALNFGLGARDPLDRHFLLAGMTTYPDTPTAYAQYDYTRFRTGLTAFMASNDVRQSDPSFCHSAYLSDSPVLRALCAPENTRLETARAYVRDTLIGRRLSHALLVGYVHTKIRNSSGLTAVGYGADDVNLSGPSVKVSLADTTVYPESVSPEHGWRFSTSIDYFRTRESSYYDDSGNRRRVEFGVLEGGPALYLPSFFDHHVNYLSVYGYGSVGPDGDFHVVSLSRYVRGLAPERAARNHRAAAFTYEYRFPVYWFSRSIHPRFSELMLRQIAFALFYDYGQAFERAAYRDRWVAGYGAKILLGLQLFHVPVPLQFEYSLARGTGPAGELQHSFAVRFGGPVDLVQSGNSLVVSDREALRAGAASPDAHLPGTFHRNDTREFLE